jgi:hypothetical protein
MNQLLNDIITLTGGAGAILSGLFLYLGKLRLEKYKSDLEIARSELKAVHEGAVHVTKSRFDKEFEIYQRLWDSLVDLKFTTLALRPEMDHVPVDKTEDEIKQERLVKFADANNEFVKLMQKHKPFYSTEVNASLETINKVARGEAIGFQYQEKKSMKYWEEQQKNKNEILEEIENCCSLIRVRIDSLSVVNR